MKLALDVWYELWENVGSESDPNSEQGSKEEDQNYRYLEENLEWDARPRNTYYQALGHLRT